MALQLTEWRDQTEAPLHAQLTSLGVSTLDKWKMKTGRLTDKFDAACAIAAGEKVVAVAKRLGVSTTRAGQMALFAERETRLSFVRKGDAIPTWLHRNPAPTHRAAVIDAIESAGAEIGVLCSTTKATSTP